jgi:hypothetical protein
MSSCDLPKICLAGNSCVGIGKLVVIHRTGDVRTTFGTDKCEIYTMVGMDKCLASFNKTTVTLY